MISFCHPSYGSDEGSNLCKISTLYEPSKLCLSTNIRVQLYWVLFKKISEHYNDFRGHKKNEHLVNFKAAFGARSQYIKGKHF